MKKLLVLLFVSLTLGAFAQAPELINYQAVIRDASGDVVPNQAISLRMSIHQGSTPGTTAYVETHSDTTNSFGLVNLQIGGGTVVSGSLGSVDWGNNIHLIQVEIDLTGGSTYEEISTTQLVSVPYSMHAATASYAPDEDADSTNEIQSLSINGDTISLSDGGQIILPAQAPNLDNDSTNEIQMLSMSGDTISLTDGGMVILPAQVPNIDNDTTNELIQNVVLSGDSLSIIESNNPYHVILTSFNQRNDVVFLNMRIDSDSLRLNTLEGQVNAGAYKDSSSSNELQILSISNDTIYLTQGGFVVLPAQAANNDNDSTNELITSLSLSGDTLHITEAGSMSSQYLGGINHWTASGTNLYYDGGKVSIGNSAFSAYSTSIYDTTNEKGLLAETWSLGTDTAVGSAGMSYSRTGNSNRIVGVWGQAQSVAGATSVTSEHNGVWGTVGANLGSLSRGVKGYSNSSTSQYNQGVFGWTNSSSSGSGYNAGIVGEAAGHSTLNYAVLGLNPGVGTSNYGGAFFSYGNVSGASKNYGAYGYSWGADTNLALYGYAADDLSAVNYGVYSQVAGTSGLAGYFIGNVAITGNLSITGSISKGSGTFKIDYPQDPENKYLVHSFVESPDMMNVYNGNVTTDENGIAVVELPEYVEPNNKDFRYQLTPFGSFAHCIVKEEIKDNKFVIATDLPNVKVSWQITGIRNDPYAKQYRIVPIEEKKGRGKRKVPAPRSLWC